MKSPKPSKKVPAKLKDLPSRKSPKGGILKTKHDTVKTTISNIH